MAILAVLLVALCVVWGMSAFQIKNELDAAQTSYRQLEAHLDRWELEEALDSVYAFAASLDKLEAEANAWEWQLASYIPYIGEDVASTRQYATIANRLANEGLKPVLLQAELLLGSSESTDLSDAIREKAAQVGDLADALSSARTVLGECGEQVEQVPPSHFDAVNEMGRTIRQIITDTTAFCDRFDLAFSVVDVVGDIASSIAEQPAEA